MLVFSYDLNLQRVVIQSRRVPEATPVRKPVASLDSGFSHPMIRRSFGTPPPRPLPKKTVS